MTAALRVIEPGLQSTLQDLGRHGYQRFGIPVSGALDWVSLKAANMLVGNPPATAAVEMSLIGPTLEVAADSVRVALVGTSSGIEIAAEGVWQRIPAGRSVRARGLR